MTPADSKLSLLVRHSAAAQDVALASELLGHLRPLERFAGLDVWSDARLCAGDETHREIARAIDQADVTLLLLSADFFASDGLVDREVPRLLERHRSGKLRVIPVLLRSCLWELHPWLKELDPLPKDREPIASRQGEARDRVLTELAKEIVLLTTPATGGITANAGEKPMEASPPGSKIGGDTYNIQIHGSTIGAFGAGTGGEVSGVVNAGRATEAAGWPHRAVMRPSKAMTPANPRDQLRQIAAALGTPSVYLSYDQADERVVGRLYATLGPHNLLFDLATHASGGERIGQIASTGINQYDRVVLVCSRKSLSNPNVLNDLKETLDREARESENARLILLDVDGFVRSADCCLPNAELMMVVRRRETISMIGADRHAAPLAMGVASLLDALKASRR